MGKGRPIRCKGCPCLDCGVSFNIKGCAYHHNQLRNCHECGNDNFPCVSGELDRIC